MYKDFFDKYMRVRQAIGDTGLKEEEIDKLIFSLLTDPFSEIQYEKLARSGVSQEEITALRESLQSLLKDGSLTTSNDIYRSERTKYNLMNDIYSRERINYGSSSSSPITSSSGSGGGSYGGGGGGCFIATAAHGTPFSENIYLLERFRDKVLSKNALGRNLIRVYNTLSPPVANYIHRRVVLRRIVRTLLVPLMWSAKKFLDH